MVLGSVGDKEGGADLSFWRLGGCAGGTSSSSSSALEKALSFMLGLALLAKLKASLPPGALAMLILNERFVELWS